MVANVVNVGLRTNEFKDFSHQSKLDFSTANTKDIYLKAKDGVHRLQAQKGYFYVKLEGGDKKLIYGI
jgi:uncharacterized pyridoxamine 5'-phosphate oxidase family protein